MINWYSVEQDITHGNVILNLTVISNLGQLSEEKDELFIMCLQTNYVYLVNFL